MEPLAPISFSQVLILMAIFLAAMVVMFIVLVLVLRRRQTKAVKFEAIHINDLIKLILSMGSFVMVLLPWFSWFLKTVLSSPKPDMPRIGGK